MFSRCYMDSGAISLNLQPHTVNTFVIPTPLSVSGKTSSGSSNNSEGFRNTKILQIYLLSTICVCNYLFMLCMCNKQRVELFQI